jgi:hypothetical protein
MNAHPIAIKLETDPDYLTWDEATPIPNFQGVYLYCPSAGPPATMRTWIENGERAHGPAVPAGRSFEKFYDNDGATSEVLHVQGQLLDMEERTTTEIKGWPVSRWHKDGWEVGTISGPGLGSETVAEALCSSTNRIEETTMANQKTHVYLNSTSTHEFDSRADAVAFVKSEDGLGAYMESGDRITWEWSDGDNGRNLGKKPDVARVVCGSDGELTDDFAVLREF